MQRLSFNSKIRIRVTRDGMSAMREFFPKGSFGVRECKGRSVDMRTFVPSSTDAYLEQPDILETRIDVIPDKYGYITLSLFELFTILDRLPKYPAHYFDEFILIEDKELSEVDQDGRADSIIFELLPDEAALFLTNLVIVEAELDIDTSNAQEIVEDAIDLHKMTQQ